MQRCAGLKAQPILCTLEHVPGKGAKPLFQAHANVCAHQKGPGDLFDAHRHLRGLGAWESLIPKSKPTPCERCGQRSCPHSFTPCPKGPFGPFGHLRVGKGRRPLPTRLLSFFRGWALLPSPPLGGR